MGILRRLALASLEICSYIGRLDSLSQARKWLETCVENHKDCTGASGQLSSFSPTRLIYIPGDFASCGVQILTKGDKRRPLKAPYMTVSHCWGWGGDAPIRLDSKSKCNFEEEGIPFGDLPKTFQYAVVITNSLGVDYLWIDSLCILQDYPTDWENEARSMCDVYMHSTCNIAALDSHNATEGCLFPRDSRLTQLEQVDSSFYLANQTELASGSEDKMPWYTTGSFLSSSLSSNLR
jgi:hypothetical protein